MSGEARADELADQAVRAESALEGPDGGGLSVGALVAMLALAVLVAVMVIYVAPTVGAGSINVVVRQP